MITNPRTVTLLIADLPPTFREDCGNQLAYIEQGSDVIVHREDLHIDEGKTSHECANQINALLALFDAYPDYHQVTLEPR
jgi:hypothetical protein